MWFHFLGLASLEDIHTQKYLYTQSNAFFASDLSQIIQKGLQRKKVLFSFSPPKLHWTTRNIFTSPHAVRQHNSSADSQAYFGVTFFPSEPKVVNIDSLRVIKSRYSQYNFSSPVSKHCQNPPSYSKFTGSNSVIIQSNFKIWFS